MPPASEYSQKIADAICERLLDGESLRTICSSPGMPARGTVFKWRGLHKSFEAQYVRAKQLGLEALADDLMHVARTTQEGETRKDTLYDTEITKADMLGHRRLVVDTAKWYLSKLAPKIYGDRSTVDVNVNDKTVARLAAGRKRTGG